MSILNRYPRNLLNLPYLKKDISWSTTTLNWTFKADKKDCSHFRDLLETCVKFFTCKHLRGEYMNILKTQDSEDHVYSKYL